MSELTESNMLSALNTISLSKELVPPTDFLGYIGKDYQRIQVVIEGARMLTPEAGYGLRGYTVVAGNKAPFEGRLRPQYMYPLPPSENDPENRLRFVYMASYELEEPKGGRHRGVFQGHFFLVLAQELDGKLVMDTSDEDQAGYCNHQWVGIWTPYGGGETKPCNWGLHRIPRSGDLDVGQDHFMPNERYWKNGWQAYVKAQHTPAED